MKNYLIHNKHSWNQRVESHLASDFYDLDAFKSGKSSLKNIELALLGDIRQKSILHLQCHFGQDSMSLSRMGAHVTGVDLSDKAIDQARILNHELGLDAKFICCDLYDLPDLLDEQFDIVFTSYGTIGWLPDLDKWASIVDRYLRPGGRFVFVEFHPIVWMFDEHFQYIKYRYFCDDPIVEQVSNSYTDHNVHLPSTEVSWNHSIAEVISSLISNKLYLQDIQEYDYSPWNCFKHTVEIGPDQFRIKHLADKIPMVYSLVVQKPQ